MTLPPENFKPESAQGTIREAYGRYGLLLILAGTGLIFAYSPLVVCGGPLIIAGIVSPIFRSSESTPPSLK